MHPPVLPWFRAYAIGMTALYVLSAGFGVFLAVSPQTFDDASKPMPSELRTFFAFYGLFIALLGIVLAAGHAVGVLAPRKPWAWVYALVVICFGLTSPCTLPMSIPLLIYWLKPDIQRYYGREVPN